MAKFEKLDRGEKPPEDQDWVLIEVGAKGGFYVSATQAGARDATFSTSEALANRAAADDLAQKLALERGLDTIFTKGIDA